MNAPKRPAAAPDRSLALAARRHFAIGWCGLVVAMSAGLVIDAMLGLKVGYYLDVDHQTRRLMWRLAHAHAAGISLVHLGIAAYFAFGARAWSARLQIASQGATLGLIAMPAGFFLGGYQLYGGEPGLGIFLTPFGGMVLIVAAACLAWDAIASTKSA
jgi:hypothetical protein